MSEEINRLLTANKQPFTVHCGACGFEWTLCYFPMRVDTFSSIGSSAHCANCGKQEIFSGPMPAIAPPPAPTPEKPAKKGKS